jgi:hypothetical protein
LDGMEKKRSGSIVENRDLTVEEMHLLRWLLEHGNPEARDFIPQLHGLRVVSRCPCGCPSIEFVPDAPGMKILSDYVYEDTKGHTIGVFAFARAGALAGIEVWSIAGDPIPERVPDPSLLRPLSSVPRPPS